MFAKRSPVTALPAWTLALLALMVLSLAVSGCGKKDETVQTNPEAVPESGEDVQNVELEDQPFGGGELQGDTAEGEDLGQAEEAEPAILLQDVFFDFDSFELDDADREALNQNARLLRDHPSAEVLIEGHCDERGTVQYNLALGEKRARQVRGYLVDLGIDGSRIDVVSYGKERPFVLGHDEEAWAQNRRAHFVVR